MVPDHMQSLVERLCANHPSLIDLEICPEAPLGMNAWRVIINALKNNSNVKKLNLRLFDSELPMAAATLMAEALINHSSLVELQFDCVNKGNIEFRRIALAVKKNPKIQRLCFQCCTILGSLQEGLCTIIRENAIESLELNSCASPQEQRTSIFLGQCALDLSNAFSHNTSLKELAIYEEDDQSRVDSIVTMQTMNDIIDMLHSNHGTMEKLCIDLHWIYGPDLAELMPRLALGVQRQMPLKSLVLKGGEGLDELSQQALQVLLETLPNLDELDLSYCKLEDEEDGELPLQVITSWMNPAHLPKILRFGGNEMGDVGAKEIARVLSENETVEELDLSDNNIGDDGAIALASALLTNRSVTHLNLSSKEFNFSTLRKSPNCFGERGAAALVEVLSVNSSLVELNLKEMPIGNAAINSLAEILTKNDTLKALSIQLLPSNDCDLKTFLSKIPEMHGLEKLEIHLDNMVGSPETARLLIVSLERNTTLKKFDLWSRPEAIQAVMSKVFRLMELNRAGRKILGSHNVPRSLWPHILAKSSNERDVLYFFLREKPELFMKQSILGKRKREPSSSAS